MKFKNIPFNSDASRFFLPWISGLLVFFATLLIATGAFCYLSLQRWQEGVAGSLTVQIPTFTTTGENRIDVLNGEIEKALTLLRSTEGITGAELMSEAEVNNLMQPWLSVGTNTTALPVPKLIDATINPKVNLDVQKLKDAFATQIPSATVEIHQMWLDGLMNFSKILIQAVATLVILLIITIAWALIYITRSSLNAHHFVISLMHMMGATDNYIIFQYAKRNALLTLGGGLIGLFVAIPALYYLNQELAQVIPVFDTLQPCGPMGLALLLLIPVGACLVAFFTTYLAVMSYLRRFI